MSVKLRLLLISRDGQAGLLCCHRTDVVSVDVRCDLEDDVDADAG